MGLKYRMILEKGTAINAVALAAVVVLFALVIFQDVTLVKMQQYNDDSQRFCEYWRHKTDSLSDENFKLYMQIFDERGFADTIEINKLFEVTQKGETWTHYATIGIYKSHQESEDEYWEVYSQFNGKNEDELWIFAYYNKFGDAVRRVKLGIEKLKPIKIY